MWLVIKRLSLGVFLIALASGILLFSDRQPSRASAGRVPRVALLQFAPTQALDDGVRGIVDALAESGFVEGKGITLRRFNAAGDVATNNTIAREITNGQYDLVVTVSTPAMQAVANANKAGKTKHVFGLVANPFKAGVGVSQEKPLEHPKQMIGFGTMMPAIEMFRIARRMFPGLKTVGVAWNAGEDNSRVFTESARAATRELGIELQEANAENSAGVREAVDSLIGRGVQAIWVGGDNTVLSALDTVIAAARKARIPVFTISPGNPERGTLFDMGADFYAVGQVTGLLAAQVLRGTDPATLPVKNFWPKRLDINATAMKGLKDPWRLPPDLLAEATVVLDDKGVHQKKAAKKLTLADALGISIPLAKKWSLGLVMYVNALDAEEAEAGIMEGLREAGLAQDRDFTIKTRNAQGDMPTLNSLLDAAVTDGADMVLTLSTPTLQAALRRVRDRPVLFTYVSDPFVAGAGKTNEEHVPNVTGCYTRSDPEALLDVVRQIVPGTRVVGTLFVPAEVNSVFQKDQLVEAGRKKGCEVVTMPANTSAEVADAALALCSRHLDAITQIPGNLTTVGFTSIAQAAEKAKVPLFGMQSAQVRMGAALAVSRDYHDGGRQTGLLAARVMRGESPASIPFQPVFQNVLVVNPKAALRYGMTLPASLVKRADRVVRE
jgi:ABC-type uncharacterized transport system substrate-binding protein